MSTSWPEVALGDVARFVNGAAFKPEDWNDDESGLRIIRIQNLNDPGKPYNRTHRKVAKDLYVSPGDLLVSWSASLGVFVWNEPDTALLNQHIFRVFPDDSLIDKDYLKHSLVGAVEKMKSQVHGATMQHINRGEFLATKIPLPPLDEQRRIAAILDKADEVRSKRKAALETLETLSQAIFIEMFGDPALASYALRDSEGKCVPMGVVSEIKTGKLDANAAVEGGEFPFFTCSRHTLKIDNAAFSGRAVLVAGNGDLNVKYYEGRFNAYQRTYVIKSSDEGFVHPKFLHGFLDLYVAKLRQQAIGGVIQYIKLPYLKDAPIRIPPWPQQEEFVSRIDGARSSAVSLRTSTTQVDQLFASLKQKAFQGAL